MAKHRHIFNPLMIEMVRIGYETGNLVASLHRLVSYLETMQEFRKKIRMALTMPLITFLFLRLLRQCLLFAWCLNLNHSLPHSNNRCRRVRVLRFADEWIYTLVWLIPVGWDWCVVCCAVMWLYRINMRVRVIVLTGLCLSIPFFGPLMLTRMCAQISSGAGTAFRRRHNGSSSSFDYNLTGR